MNTLNNFTVPQVLGITFYSKEGPNSYSLAQSGASYLSQDFVMFFHVSCEGLPGQ